MEQNILLIVVGILVTIVFVGYLNEKLFKISDEIALLLVSLVISIGIALYSSFVKELSYSGDAVHFLREILIDGMLCFMLFAGAFKISFHKIKSQLKSIGLMALVATICSALIYGILFWGILVVGVGLPMNFWHCLLLGAVIVPTDPIAAMSILKKVGLAKDTELLVEGESLFNDGVGIALFIIISQLVESGESSFDFLNFMFLLSKEVLGAIVIAIIISVIMLYFFKRTTCKQMEVMISLLTVAAIYVVCEYLGFSSAIAAVVCGITFASVTERYRKEDRRLYNDFWLVLDTMLNRTLYIFLGTTILSVYAFGITYLYVGIVAIICSFLARFVGVYTAGIFIKEKPQGLRPIPFAFFFTYAGLKGALSLALVVDTATILDVDIFHLFLVATFSIVMFTTLVQGLSVGKIYKLVSK